MPSSTKGKEPQPQHPDQGAAASEGHASVEPAENEGSDSEASPTDKGNHAQEQSSDAKAAPTPADEKGQREPYARAAREDDDGYDPWSDRPASNPFWEEDPWR